MQSLKSNELVKIKKPVIPRFLSLNITGWFLIMEVRGIEPLSKHNAMQASTLIVVSFEVSPLWTPYDPANHNDYPDDLFLTIQDAQLNVAQ